MFKRGVISSYVIFILLTSILLNFFIFSDNLEDNIVEAVNIYVDDDGGADYTTIQEAIDHANTGDTIYVWAGTYDEEIIINKTLTIIGNGTSNTTIKGTGTNDVVTITEDWVNMSGFTVTSSINWDTMGVVVKEAKYCSITNNNCSNNDIGILLYSSNYTRIINNTCNNNLYAGIQVGYSYPSTTSNFSIIANNTCNNNNFNGIYLFYSDLNLIKNNNCSSNEQNIYIYASHNNTIINNTCSGNNNRFDIKISSSDYNIICNNTSSGIIIFNSLSNTIKNNTLFSSGLLISEGIVRTVNYWASHDVEDNTLNSRPIYFKKNVDGGIIPADAGQIILVNCSNMTISDQHFEEDIIGIYLVNSKNMIISDNICDSPNSTGIYLYLSDENKIVSNNFTISLSDSYSNTISNNICKFSNYPGISIKGSSDKASKRNIINNNTCEFNYCGIYSFSEYDIFSNNTCNNNYWYGMNLNRVESISIENNQILKNRIGIQIEYSYNNIIKFNNFSDNEYGMNISRSWDNTFYENYFSNNFEVGILVYDRSRSNNIYRNNIISNKKQVAFEGNYPDAKLENQWDNGAGEGNYWSNYAGVDNGADNRPVNDGIGDTEIPHLDLDNYPFIKPYGWREPSAPIIESSTDSAPHGNYEIIWNKTRSTKNYVLQEDDNISFSSPEVYYNGWYKHKDRFIFNCINKSENRYYYRVKALSEVSESSWSNIIDVIVDYLPEIPKEFTAEVFPKGNAINLSWKPNTEDTTEYELYYNTVKTFGWVHLVTIPHPNNFFNNIGLTNGKEYNYTIRAKDSRGQYSDFSSIINAVPLDSLAPEPPVGLNISTITAESIELSWSAGRDRDIVGYKIYRNTTPILSKDNDLIGTTKIGELFYEDDDLDENTRYYYGITAFDEVPNESELSEIINGTTLFGPHGPEIDTPVADFEIVEDGYDYTTINLFRWFKDVNNDPLEFRCIGNVHIEVIIFPENGSVLLIPEENWNGLETLVFHASDGLSNVSDDVLITVTPVNDPPENLEIISPTGINRFELGTLIDFKATCDDPDLPYGERLIFKWSSNISGELGTGASIFRIFLPTGNHTITVVVSDQENLSLNETINVLITATVKPTGNETGTPDKKPENDKTDLNTQIFAFSIGIIIFVLIFGFLLFLVLRKKKARLRSEQKTQKTLSQLGGTPVKKKSVDYTSTPGKDIEEVLIPETITPTPQLKHQPPSQSQIRPKAPSIQHLSPTTPRIKSPSVKSARLRIPPGLARPLLPTGTDKDENDQVNISSKHDSEEIKTPKQQEENTGDNIEQ